MTATLAFAASAGMLAAFNPCGFALLPGYLALFLGSPVSREGTVRRALLVGAAVTVGFVAVFGAVGVAVATLSFALGSWLFVVTLIAGLLLLAVGVLLLVGRELSVRLPRAQLAVGGSVPGMIAYGVVYATVSLSCTLPVFLAAVVLVGTVPGASLLTGGLSALSYAVGMGLVMTGLALVAGLLGQGVLARARSWTRHLGRASGAVVVMAAMYVLWYGWVELQSYNGKPVAPGPVAWVAELSARVSQFVADAGPARTALVLGLGIAVTAAAAVVTNRRPRLRQHPPESAPQAEAADPPPEPVDR